VRCRRHSVVASQIVSQTVIDKGGREGAYGDGAGGDASTDVVEVLFEEPRLPQRTTHRVQHGIGKPRVCAVR
jgi:hypothetical protein